VFLHVEKRLLKMRGILKSTGVRDATMDVPEADRGYVEFLCEQTLKVVKECAGKR
jgi:hypothetical protein